MNNSKKVLLRTSLLGVFLALIACLYFMAGNFELINFLPFKLIVACSSLFFVFYHLISSARVLSFSNNTEKVISFFVVTCILLLLVHCLLPPLIRDELSQHLALPKIYSLQGQVVHLPNATYSYYPMLVNMLYTPWISWNMDSVTKLIHVSFALATASLIHNFLQQYVNKTYSLLGVLIFLSIPNIFRTATLAYLDIALLFFSTASILCFFTYCEIKQKRFLFLAYILMGAACATKPNGGVCAIVLVLIHVAYLLLTNSALNKTNIISSTLAGLLLPIFCIPWFISNYFTTSNPFFPFLNSLFPPSNQPSMSALLSYSEPVSELKIRLWIYGESIWQYLALPLRVFFFGQDDSPRYFDGRLSPLLILFLPFVIKNRKFWILSSFAIIYLVSTLYLAGIRVRYLLPTVPMLCILAIIGLEVLNTRKKLQQISQLTVVLCIGLNFTYIFSLMHKHSPYSYLLGLETRQEFLLRTIPDYSAINFINTSTPDNSKIYMMLTGRKGYYLDRDYYFDYSELPELIHDNLHSAENYNQLLSALIAKQITHLFIRNDLLMKFFKDNLTENEVGLWSEFINSNCKLLYTDKNYSVFILNTLSN
jgi:4-amino-4-deoxy-L-arabinose transferase-like glycosyltransferase